MYKRLSIFRDRAVYRMLFRIFIYVEIRINVLFCSLSFVIYEVVYSILRQCYLYSEDRNINIALVLLYFFVFCMDNPSIAHILKCLLEPYVSCFRSSDVLLLNY